MYTVNESERVNQEGRLINSRSAAVPDELTAELSREFGAPVALLDHKRGEWLGCTGISNTQLPSPDQDFLKSLATFGRKRVGLWKSEKHPGIVWMAVVLRGKASVVVAWAGFATSFSLSRDSAVAWGPVCPEPALKAWGQSVAERLDSEARTLSQPGTASSSSSSSTNGEGNDNVIVARLIRRLRISDSPEKFQQLATNALRTAMNLKAVAWVPIHHSEPVVTSGDIGSLKGPGYRTLLPTVQKDGTYIVNNPESSPDPDLRRMIAVAATSQTTIGWLIAMNPLDDRDLTNVDSELLQPVASLIATQQTNAKVYADLKELIFGVIRALTAAIDAKDPYTSGHSERVARIAIRIAEELGMSANQRGDLYVMGLLHDVGKIGVDDAVLKKPGPLTPDEYRMVQSHVEIGVHILTDLKKLNHLLPGVRHHHESLDGSGYPDGLAGDAIPFEARILAVADSFDAMSSTRPYRKRLSPGQIDEILRKGANVQWDPKIIEALFACRADLEMIRQKGLGDSLQLAVSGTLGRK